MGNMVTKLTITQLCSSFPAFIKTCVYNHIHKSQLDTTLSRSNNHPYLHIILHKAKFYYFLPPILFMSPGWLLSFHFSDQHNICIFLSLITLTCGAEYKLWSPFFLIFHLFITSPFQRWNNLLSTSFPTTNLFTSNKVQH